jgi:hypothetical protein
MRTNLATTLDPTRRSKNATESDMTFSLGLATVFFINCILPLERESSAARWPRECAYFDPAVRFEGPRFVLNGPPLAVGLQLESGRGGCNIALEYD